MSSYFNISNGIRQGGILSPSLFAIYMDDLSSLLNTSRIGCHISDVCIKEECSVFLKKKLLWMKTMHYPNIIRSHLVTIVPVAPFTPKSTSKLRSALHIRYSKVIPRFSSRANTAQT